MVHFQIARDTSGNLLINGLQSLPMMTVIGWQLILEISCSEPLKISLTIDILRRSFNTCIDTTCFNRFTGLSWGCIYKQKGDNIKTSNAMFDEASCFDVRRVSLKCVL
jgi:hypothetical protein